MRRLLFIFTLFISIVTNAQVVGRQNTDQYPVTSWGTLTYGLTWLPNGYANTAGYNKKYPLIIFLHGAGEAGTTAAHLSRLLNNSIPKMISQGWNATVINPLTNQPDSFIVISPQAGGWSYNYASLKYILPNVLSRYRVDETRIYLTGLSAGGAGVFSVLGSNDSTFTRKFAAMATSSSAGVDGVNGYTDLQVEAQLRNAKRDSVHVWTVAGEQDYLLDTDVRYHDSTNKLSPAIPNKLTVIATLAHSTWTKQYDTAFRPTLNYYGNSANCTSGCPSITAPNNNGSPVRGTGATQDSLNVYEWFLLWSRTAVFTISAGADQTIELPTNSVTLTGSAVPSQGNTISSYGWSKVSGGSATITSPSSSTTTVTGLLAGSYTFRITVTESTGTVKTDDVSITVNASTEHYAPLIVAGADQSITLPTSTANITSSTTIYDGETETISWTKFRIPDYNKSGVKIYGLGSSTMSGLNGPTTSDSSFISRVRQYYVGRGLVDSVLNYGVDGGADLGIAFPTGYTSPFGLQSPLSTNNISKVLSTGGDNSKKIVIINFPTNSLDGSITATQYAQALQILKDTLESYGIATYITTTQPRQDFNSTIEAKLKVVRDTIMNRFGDRALDFYTGLTVPGTTQMIPIYASSDSIHMTNAGHERFFQIVKEKNILKTLMATASSISTPTAKNTAITGLTEGVHTFQVGVMDGRGLAASDTVTVTVNAEVGCSGTSYTPTPAGDSGYYNTYNLQPGDTLYLDGSHTFSYVYLFNRHGTANCPIIITNKNGQAKLRGDELKLENCSYIKVLGNGDISHTYGISIRPYGVDTIVNGKFGINILGKSKNIEIGHVKISNAGMGMSIKHDPDCDTTYNYPNYVMDSITIHNNHITQTWNQGLYIGNTAADNNQYGYSPRPIVCSGDTVYYNPMRLGHVKVYNNYIDSTGRGGIQLSAASHGLNEIYNNTVRHSGMNGDEAQGNAIVLGAYTSAHIYNNTVSNTYTHGIASEGGSNTDTTIKIWNNSIDSSGYLAAYDLSVTGRYEIKISTEPTYSDSLSWPYSTFIKTIFQDNDDSTRFSIKDNQFGLRKQTYGVGIFDQSNTIQANDNIICGNTNTLGGSVTVNVEGANSVTWGSDCISCVGTKKYVTPNSTGGGYNSYYSSSPGYNPGDTIVLQASYNPWGYFGFGSTNGTAACPIVVINEGGQVQLKDGIAFENVQYVKVLGNLGGQQYGFKVESNLADPNNVAIGIAKKSKNVEVSHVYVTNAEYGCWIKNEAECDTTINYPNWWLDSISVHDCYFKGMDSQGFYMGSTDPNNFDRSITCDSSGFSVTKWYTPTRLRNIKIYNNIIDSTGRPGIQLSAGMEGVNEIYNNTISNVGTQYDDAQGAGISLGGYTRALVYGNRIKKTLTWGIVALGASGVSKIYDNIIDSSGRLGDTTILWPSNIHVDTRSTIPVDSTTVQIRNNVMNNPGSSSYNITISDLQGTMSNKNVICNNITFGNKPATLSTSEAIQSKNCNVAFHALPSITLGGPDTITLPLDSITLNVTLVTTSDTAGRIYKWTKLKSPSATNKRITVIGSSTVEGYGVSATQNFVYLLKEHYKGLGLIDTIYNLGLGGTDPINYNYTTALNKGAEIFLMSFPTNGYDSYSISTILAEYREARDSCLGRGVEFFCTGTQPRNPYSDANRIKLNTINDSLRNIFGERFIDFNTFLLNKDGNLMKTAYDQGDGFHINAAGHAQLAELVIAANMFQSFATGSTLNSHSAVIDSTRATDNAVGSHLYQLSVWDTYGVANSEVYQLVQEDEPAAPGEPYKGFKLRGRRIKL